MKIFFSRETVKITTGDWDYNNKLAKCQSSNYKVISNDEEVFTNIQGKTDGGIDLTIRDLEATGKLDKVTSNNRDTKPSSKIPNL